MARKRLTILSWFLLLIAAACLGLFGVLVGWGGRIESVLLVDGKPVFVELDASRPRTWLLFGLPGLFAAGAIAARRSRDTE